jgi:hypothetical protein
VAEDSLVNARLSGLTIKVLDFGNGFYIEVLNDKKKGIYYRSCMPGGAICRYSDDFWRAKTYLHQMMNP